MHRSQARRRKCQSGSHGPLSWCILMAMWKVSALKTAFLLMVQSSFCMVMVTLTSTQEVVLRLDDETMQRLIVGVADHQDATASQSLIQPQDQIVPSTSGNSTNPR